MFLLIIIYHKICITAVWGSTICSSSSCIFLYNYVTLSDIILYHNQLTMSILDAILKASLIITRTIFIASIMGGYIICWNGQLLLLLMLKEELLLHDELLLLLLLLKQHLLMLLLLLLNQHLLLYLLLFDESEMLQETPHVEIILLRVDPEPPVDVLEKFHLKKIHFL